MSALRYNRVRARHNSTMKGDVAVAWKCDSPIVITMNIKKIFIAAAAVLLAFAAPMTGVLSVPLSVTVHAAEYEEGDVFAAELDKNGALTNSFDTVNPDTYSYFMSYLCTVKSDKTLKIDFLFDCQADGCFPAAFIGKTVSIPGEINGYPVTEIGNCIDLGCTKLIIPDSVTEIGDMSFAFNPFLEEVVFGENSQLKRIGNYAFTECRSLKSVTIPANVEIIAFGAFINGDTGSVTGTYANADLETKEYDFSDQFSLTTVTFDEGSKLKELEEGAFQYQKALTAITLHDSLEKIGYGVFMGCAALTEITIPSNVNEIGFAAFNPLPGDWETNLTRIEVAADNENYKSVDGILFSKDGKTVVAYPSARDAGSYEIPADVCKVAEGAFECNRNLASVIIPEGVTDIPENTFAYCTALTEAVLPDTLKTIGKWAFEACALTSIDIPEHVDAIDAQAFEKTPLKNINGAEGSYAETFAKEHGYTFNGIDIESSVGKSDVSEPSEDPIESYPNTGDAGAAPIASIALLAGMALVIVYKKQR